MAIDPPVPAAPAPENPDQPALPAVPAPAAPAPVVPAPPAPSAVTWTSTFSSRVTFPEVQVNDHATSLRERLNLPDTTSPLKETPHPLELTSRLPETEVIRKVHSKKPFCVRPPEETADALATYFAEDRAGTVLALCANLGNLQHEDGMAVDPPLPKRPRCSISPLLARRRPPLPRSPTPQSP